MRGKGGAWQAVGGKGGGGEGLGEETGGGWARGLGEILPKLLRLCKETLF